MSPQRRPVMSGPHIDLARLVAQAAFWLALGIGLGVAFGDSLGQAVLWLMVAVAIGLAARRARLRGQRRSCSRSDTSRSVPKRPV
jgi:hypothetical protein